MAHLAKYALKETVVEVMRWDGGDINFRVLQEWTDNRVRLSGTEVILQSPDRTERVELGSYIVRTDAVSFYPYSFEELNDLYVEVKAL